MSASAREKFIHALDDLILRARVVEPERIEIIGLIVDAYGEVENEERLRSFRDGIEAAARRADRWYEKQDEEPTSPGEAIRALAAPAAPKEEAP